MKMNKDFGAITQRMADTGSARWAVHFAAKDRELKGEDMVILTIGEPDISPDAALIEAAHKSMLSGRCGYSAGRGESDLLAVLADKYRAFDPRITTDNILCFAGAQAALFVTFLGILDAGDQVLVPNPYYATYDGVISAGGGIRVDVPLEQSNDYCLTVAALELAYQPKCKALLLNNPHNPTGAVLDEAAILAIVQFCQKHNLWLICDEVYEALVYEGSVVSALKIASDYVPNYKKLVIISSISKTLAAPGFRSGWAVGSDEFCTQILPISEAIFFGNQPFIADATAYGLAHKIDTASQMRQDYYRRAKFLCSELSRIKGLKPYMPKAGMFLFLDVTGTGLNGEEFAHRLLDYGVALMPGGSFGECGAHAVRFGLTIPDDRLALAVSRIKEFSQSF